MCVERDGGRRRKEEEGELERERNDRKYERELRVTAENGGLCVFNPPLPALPLRPRLSFLPRLAAASTFAVAQTRFRKPPSYV